MTDEIQKNVSNDNTKEMSPKDSMMLMVEIDSRRSSIDTWTNCFRRHFSQATKI